MSQNQGKKFPAGNACKRAIFIALTIASALWLSFANAQDLEPRSYVNIPIGVNFIAAGYVHSQGDLSPTPSAPLQNAKLSIDGLALGYAHTFAMGGKSSKIDIIAASVCYKGSATLNGDIVSADRCEFTDPSIKLTWNFLGAPALDLKEFAQWQPGFVAGASLLTGIPLGTYNKNHLLNGGTNRWLLKPGIGMSYNVGNFHYELTTSVSFFTDNDEYFNRVSLSQAPLYNFQGHIIYSFTKGRWLAFDANYFIGGETTKNSIESDDAMKNSRLGMTYSMPLSTTQSMKIYANSGVVTRIGNDFNSFGINWLYRF